MLYAESLFKYSSTWTFSITFDPFFVVDMDVGFPIPNIIFLSDKQLHLTYGTYSRRFHRYVRYLLISITCETSKDYKLLLILKNWIRHLLLLLFKRWKCFSDCSTIQEKMLWIFNNLEILFPLNGYVHDAHKI